MKLFYALKRKTNRVLAVHFSENFVGLSCLEKNRRACSLVDFSFIEIDCLEKNRQVVINFIIEFVKKNKINKQGAYLAIPSLSDVDIAILDLPLIPKNEIVKAARWQLKEKFSFDPARSILDWDILEKKEDKDKGDSYRVIFAAVENKALGRYLSLVSESKLLPLKISAAPFVYGNILAGAGKKETREIVLEIRKDCAVFCVYENGRLIFIRELLFSLDKFIRSLEGTLILGEEKVKLSLEDAKKISEKFGIPKNPSQVIEGKIKAINIFSLMRPALEELVKEFSRSLYYFNKTFSFKSPQSFYLWTEKKLKNLEWYLSKETGLRVESLPLPFSLGGQKIKQKIPEEHRDKLISVLGAAAESAQPINLLPGEFKIRKRKLIQKFVLKTGFFLFLAVFVVLLFSVKIKTEDYKTRLRNARLHLEVIQEVRILNEKISQRRNLSAIIKGRKIPADALLQLISSKIFPGIILNELFFDQTEKLLVLKGEVSAPEDVGHTLLIDFVEKIEESPLFLQARLIEYRSLREGRFEIRCNLIK